MGQTFRMCSAMDGDTIWSRRPWVTRTGTRSRRSTSSESIWREIKAPSTSGGTETLPLSPVSRSAGSSGCAVMLCQKRRRAAILVGRSGSAPAGALARKAGPMSSKLSFRVTAAPTKLIAATASWPYART